ncbi:MAG: OmpH family outer membrane protein [Smithella sp.]
MAADKTDKIGFVNLQEVLQKSNAGKKDVEDLKKFIEKNNQEIKSEEEELKKMKEALEKKDSGTDQGSQSEKETAYQKKLRNYQSKVNDANEELKKRDQEMTQKLMPGIIKVVRSFAEREKYTLIIDIATTPMPFYTKDSDITDKVIEEFNKAE